MAEAEQTISLYAKEEAKRRPFLIDLAMRLVKEKPLGTAGLAIILVLFLSGTFADLVAPYGYNVIHMSDRLAVPSLKYILGADNLGRDLLSRIIYGARISMFVALGAATLDVVIATFLGTVSGYFGGKTDIIIQRFVDAWMCFPAIFIYLSVMSILGPGLPQVILVLGVHGGIRSSRVIRSAVISIEGNAYLEAARAIGAPARNILARHILPNIMAPILIIFTLVMGAAILAEATLSFLGLGIPPPMPSWGGMLSGNGRAYMLTAPWLALWPGLALAFVVFGINMLGDALRDLLDPRLRGGLGRYVGVKSKKPKGSAQA